MARSNWRTLSFTSLLLTLATLGRAQASVEVTVNTETQLTIEQQVGEYTYALDVQTDSPGSYISKYLVTLYRTSEAVLTAEVITHSEESYTAQGTSDGQGFELTVTSAGEGYTYYNEVGSESSSLSIDSYGPTTAEGEDLLSTLTNAPSGLTATAAQIDEILADVAETGFANLKLFNSAIAVSRAAGATSGVSMAPDPLITAQGTIGDFYDCQHDACLEAGGCWNPQNTFACQACAGMTILETATAFTLWQIGLQACTMSPVLSVICKILC